MRSKIERRDGRCRYCIAWGVASVFVLMHGAEETFGAVVDINLVALSTPSGSDTAASLPPTQSTVAPGASFFVEIWAQTTHSNGLTSVSLDLVYDGSLVDGIGITHTALFPELHSGTIDNPSGLVDDLSGSHLGPCTDEVGVSLLGLGANAASGHVDPFPDHGEHVVSPRRSFMASSPHPRGL